jgi:hypothetical protein
VRFYSSLDEETFFSWLERIAAVKKVRGERENIIIDCDRALMTDEALRELIAVFFRYGVDTKQLDIFETDANRSWFCDKRAYWRQPNLSRG